MPNDHKCIEVGDSFSIRNIYGLHLHVVVAEASPIDSATIFLVYISSVDSPSKDSTTIIHAGEHSFITHESWVRYQNVLICSRNEIQKLIVEEFEKVSPDLLTRIQDGVMNSERVLDRDKATFKEWKMDKTFRDMK